MAFLIETLITHFFQVYIFKVFDWNEKKYDEIIHYKNIFVFRHKSKLFIFLKFFLFFLLLICIVTFLFIYFYELYHNGEQVPFKEPSHPLRHGSERTDIISQPDYEELGRDSWVFLLFAIFFLVDWQNEAKLLFGKKKSWIQRLNIYYSCYMPYYVVLIFICSLRLILLFTLDDGLVVMNYSKVQHILLEYPHESLSFVLYVSYYFLTFTSIFMILVSFGVLFFHPHLKEEYFVQCIKMNKHWARILKMPYYEGWFEIKQKVSIKQKFINFWKYYIRNTKDEENEHETQETNYNFSSSQQRLVDELKKNAEKQGLNESRLKINSKNKLNKKHPKNNIKNYSNQTLIPLTETLACPLYYDDNIFKHHSHLKQDHKYLNDLVFYFKHKHKKTKQKTKNN